MYWLSLGVGEVPIEPRDGKGPDWAWGGQGPYLASRGSGPPARGKVLADVAELQLGGVQDPDWVRSNCKDQAQSVLAAGQARQHCWPGLGTSEP